MNKTRARSRMVTPVASVPSTATLSDGTALFAAAHMSAAPIVDVEQHLLGIECDTDIVDALLSTPATAATALDVVSGVAVTIDAHDFAEKALGLFSEKQIHALLAVRSHRLLGIITLDDVIRRPAHAPLTGADCARPAARAPRDCLACPTHRSATEGASHDDRPRPC